MTAWSAFYGVEILAPTLSAKMHAAQWEYVSFALIPVFWLAFALEYSGRKAWLTPIRILALCIIPAFTITLAATNDYHHLIWEKVSLGPLGYPSINIEIYGAWFWVHTIYSYLLILAGIALFGVNFFLAQSVFRNQIKLVLIGSMILLGVNAVTLFGPFDLHGFDLTPAGFAAVSILTFFGYFRFNLLRLMPIASTLALENLRDAVIVLNSQMLVVNINATARDWWRLGDETIGREARASLPMLAPLWDNWNAGQVAQHIQMGAGEQERHFDASLLELYGSKKTVTGWVVIVRDTTREQALLKIESRHARQMEILNSITRITLEAGAFEEMLDSLAEHLGELLDADGAYITLWDETSQRTIPAAANLGVRDVYKNLVVEPDEITLTASVLREERILVVEDVHNTPYMSPRIAARFPTRSMMALPLIADGRKLGAALIGFNQPHVFNEREVALGEQVAAQLAVALNKAQLLSTLSRRVVQLSLLQQVSEQLIKSLDEKEIYQSAVHAIIEVFGYDEAAISLVADGNQLELVSIGGAKDFGFEKGFRQNIGQGIMGHVAETLEPYFTANVENDPHYYHPSGQGMGAAIGVPMLYEKKLIGVVYVQNADPNSILREDIPALETLANHLATALQNARLFEETRNNLIATTSMQSISQIVTSSLELERIFKSVVALLQEKFGYTYVSIYLLEGDVLQLGAQIGYPDELVIREIRITSGVTGRAIRMRQTQFLPTVLNDSSFLRASYEVQSEICVPLVKNDIALGVLNVEATASRPLTQKDVELLEAFARPVSMAVDNARLHGKVKSLALTDGLTGLINRRAFDQALETEVARSIRYAHPLSLIIVDIDSFKEYNDLHGHPAGDERIKALAGILAENVRHPDIAARHGGEEFAVILPHTDKIGALVMAERLRLAAASQCPGNMPSPGHPVSGYTISLGVASCPQDGRTSRDIFIAADYAELKAKRLGKNQTCTADIAEKPIS